MRMALLDTITGTIARRILLNYRIDPIVAQEILPKGFRPLLYHRYAIGGVCLIRFEGLRPNFLPFWLGATSENAAFRYAVEWEHDGEPKTGVYIPRRESNSALNRALGGRVFPGLFHRSRFDVEESDTAIRIQVESQDDEHEIDLTVAYDTDFCSTSVFPDLQSASEFFLQGAVGYSATNDDQRFQGIELESHEWVVEPLRIEHAHSTYFDDPVRFPPGSIELDCALLMRNIRHSWHTLPDLCATQSESGSIQLM
ncbi:MAG: hypothetical protein GC165_04165 [Armatimonadetes bacterium]|nr:hypothetical protein [Armatimonadota bacterium]